jgi:hypothetical protein
LSQEHDASLALAAVATDPEVSQLITKKPRLKRTSKTTIESNTIKKYKVNNKKLELPEAPKFYLDGDTRLR